MIRNERGSGTLSTAFGVGVVLVLITFCSHVLLNLWTMSAVDDVAHDAATDVATSGVDDSQLAAVEQQAITRAREALGDYGSRVEFRFESPTPDEVVLRVRAPGLGILSSAGGIGAIDRLVVVSRERAER